MFETLSNHRGDRPGARITVAISRLASSIRFRARTRASARRLSTTQGEILLCMLREPGIGMEGLARTLAVSRPTVSDAVEALVRKGLVAKCRSATNARQLRLELTEPGRIEAQHGEDWLDDLCDAVETMTPQEQQAWMSGLERMLNVLGTIEPSGIVRAQPVRTRVSGAPMSGTGAEPEGTARREGGDAVSP